MDKIILYSDVQSLKNLRSTCKGLYATRALNQKIIACTKLSVTLMEGKDATKFYGFLNNSVAFPANVSVNHYSSRTMFNWTSVFDFFEKFGCDIEHLSLYLGEYKDQYLLADFWPHLNKPKSLRLNFNLCAYKSCAVKFKRTNSYNCFPSLKLVSLPFVSLMQHDVKKFISKLNFARGLKLTSPIATDLDLDVQGIVLEYFDEGFGLCAIFDYHTNVYRFKKKKLETKYVYRN